MQTAILNLSISLCWGFIPNSDNQIQVYNSVTEASDVVWYALDLRPVSVCQKNMDLSLFLWCTTDGLDNLRMSSCLIKDKMALCSARFISLKLKYLELTV